VVQSEPDRELSPQIRLSADELSDPLYFFSITHSALVQEPWCEGVVYILPRRSFEREAAQQVQGMEIVFPHWISAEPADPLGELRVGPDDFPFLRQIQGRNDEKLVELVTAHPDRFPWPEALESQAASAEIVPATDTFWHWRQRRKCDTVCASLLATSARRARTPDNDLQVHNQNCLTDIEADIPHIRC